MKNYLRQVNDPLRTLKNALSRWRGGGQIQELEFKNVSNLQVVNFIKSLNTSQAFGHGELDCETLKIAPESIAAPISHIINLAIRQRKFPNRWKIGRIIPLFKGGKKDKMDPSSFRPISLLPAVSKIMEKVLQSQLVYHMNSQHLWHGNLHSYRSFLSSTTALAQVTDTAITASDEKKIATTIAIDESAAFDSINHDILLNKLGLYKLNQNSMELLKSYLSDRSEYVNIGAQNSRMQSTLTGVPQGSILGPTLFNIYINDMPDIVNDHDTCKDPVHTPSDRLFTKNCNICGNLSTFADDAIYTTANLKRNVNQERLRIILDRLTEYLNDSR